VRVKDDSPMDQSEKTRAGTSVTWSSIYVSAGFFLSGVISALFLFDMKDTPASFTPLDLIGFSLSVALSGASIVLALAAMSSSRASEDALTRRSDESIRLQNEVFLKTTEALAKIESSTGVTEKRIEDIIAGRVGAIAESVAESTLKGGKPVSEKELQARVQEAIQQAVSPAGNLAPEVRAERMAKLAEVRRQRQLNESEYLQKHEALLQGLAGSGGLKALRLGHGDVQEEGPEKFDALYRLNSGKKVWLSTFRSNTDTSEVSEFFIGLPKLLSDVEVEKLFIVLFGVKEEVEAAVKEVISAFKDELSRKIFVTNTPDPDAVLLEAKRSLGLS